MGRKNRNLKAKAGFSLTSTQPKIREEKISCRLEQQTLSYEEMNDQMQKALPSGCKPDFGHCYVKMSGEQPIDIAFNRRFILAKDSEKGYMLNISIKDYCLSILLNWQQLKTLNLSQYFTKIKGESGFIIDSDSFFSCQIKPLVGSRFQAKNGEWVIPFELVQ